MKRFFITLLMLGSGACLYAMESKRVKDVDSAQSFSLRDWCTQKQNLESLGLVGLGSMLLIKCEEKNLLGRGTGFLMTISGFAHSQGYLRPALAYGLNFIQQKSPSEGNQQASK